MTSDRSASIPGRRSDHASRCDTRSRIGNGLGCCLRARTASRTVRLRSMRRVAQGDLVGLGYVVGLDGSQPLAQALAGLPQQLEGVAGGTRRRAALRVGAVFLDEVGLQGGGDFVGRLQRLVDGPVPCCVVNHADSIAPLAGWRGRAFGPIRELSGTTGTRRIFLAPIRSVYLAKAACPDQCY